MQPITVMNNRINQPDADLAASDAGSVPEGLTDILNFLKVRLTHEQIASLGAYLDLLIETNKQFNLTAIRNRDLGWSKHIIDSLTVVPFMSELRPGATVIDIGSGGGLPGVVIAIARPDLRVTLLEATKKKARFLEQCIEELNLENTRVVCDRAETIGRISTRRGRYDAAVCRAIGPMNVLLELALPLLRVGGVLWAMKGPKGLDELNVSSDALMVLGAGEVDVAFAYPEAFNVSTIIITVAKAHTTPKPYPRLPGTPKQSPL